MVPPIHQTISAAWNGTHTQEERGGERGREIEIERQRERQRQMEEEIDTNITNDVCLSLSSETVLQQQPERSFFFFNHSEIS